MRKHGAILAVIGSGLIATATCRAAGAEASAAVSLLANNHVVSHLTGRTGGERCFRMDVPAGQTRLTVLAEATGGTCSLYVSHGHRPTAGGGEHVSTGTGSAREVTVARPAAGAWYVLLRGSGGPWSASLVASWWMRGKYHTYRTRHADGSGEAVPIDWTMLGPQVGGSAEIPSILLRLRRQRATIRLSSASRPASARPRKSTPRRSTTGSTRYTQRVVTERIYYPAPVVPTARVARTPVTTGQPATSGELIVRNGVLYKKIIPPTVATLNSDLLRRPIYVRVGPVGRNWSAGNRMGSSAPARRVSSVGVGRRVTVGRTARPTAPRRTRSTSAWRPGKASSAWRPAGRTAR